MPHVTCNHNTDQGRVLLGSSSLFQKSLKEHAPFPRAGRKVEEGRALPTSSRVGRVGSSDYSSRTVEVATGRAHGASSGKGWKSPIKHAPAEYQAPVNIQCV